MTPETEAAKINVAMLVDDDAVDQLIYQRVIERSGLIQKTISFHYADEALSYLRDKANDAVDVIFLDINMPRMNGFEFLDAVIDEFGDDFCSVVVIMITTSVDPRDRDKANRYSLIKDFINKPLTVEDVFKVSALLKGK